jgi:hypothetical protein
LDLAVGFLEVWVDIHYWLEVLVRGYLYEVATDEVGGDRDCGSFWAAPYSAVSQAEIDIASATENDFTLLRYDHERGGE